MKYTLFSAMVLLGLISYKANAQQDVQLLNQQNLTFMGQMFNYSSFLLNDTNNSYSIAFSSFALMSSEANSEMDAVSMPQCVFFHLNNSASYLRSCNFLNPDFFINSTQLYQINKDLITAQFLEQQAVNQTEQIIDDEDDDGQLVPDGLIFNNTNQVDQEDQEEQDEDDGQLVPDGLIFNNTNPNAQPESNLTLNATLNPTNGSEVNATGLSEQELLQDKYFALYNAWRLNISYWEFMILKNFYTVNQTQLETFLNSTVQQLVEIVDNSTNMTNATNASEAVNNTQNASGSQQNNGTFTGWNITIGQSELPQQQVENITVVQNDTDGRRRLQEDDNQTAGEEVNGWWDNFGNWVQNTTESIGDWFSNGTDSVGDFVGNSTDNVNNTISNITEGVAGAVNETVEVISNVTDAVGDFFQGLGRDIANTTERAWNATENFTERAWNKTKDVAIDITGGIIGVSVLTWDAIADATSDVFDDIEYWFDNSWDKLTNYTREEILNATMWIQEQYNYSISSANQNYAQNVEIPMMEAIVSFFELGMSEIELYQDQIVAALGNNSLPVIEKLFNLSAPSLEIPSFNIAGQQINGALASQVLAECLMQDGVTGEILLTCSEDSLSLLYSFANNVTDPMVLSQIMNNLPSLPEFFFISNFDQNINNALQSQVAVNGTA